MLRSFPNADAAEDAATLGAAAGRGQAASGAVACAASAAVAWTGALADLARIPAMDLLKKIGKYVEEFGDRQVVALFLPVFSSPSRALCAEYWQNATIGWSRNFSTYFWPFLANLQG